MMVRTLVAGGLRACAFSSTRPAGLTTNWSAASTSCCGERVARRMRREREQAAGAARARPRAQRLGVSARCVSHGSRRGDERDGWLGVEVARK